MPSGYLVGAPDGAEGGSWFTVRRWYVSDGDRIEEGQPLVRLHNEMGQLGFQLPGAGGLAGDLCLGIGQVGLERGAAGGRVAVFRGRGAFLRGQVRAPSRKRKRPAPGELASGYAGPAETSFFACLSYLALPSYMR
jgi:hypothetical protein